MQPMWLCILSGRQFEETFENVQWRKVKRMQPMWLRIQWCGQFEDTFKDAQWRKVKQMQPMHYGLSPVGIWKLGKIWPWLPFSQARIISDENIWILSPFQFHFQFIFGYELKTVCCSSKIDKESVAIQTDCWKDVNKIEGPSWT